MDAYESELEDARQIITKLKVGGDEPFLYAKSDHPLNGKGVQPIRYTIRVTHGKDERTYDGGHGLSWLTQFEEDVKAGRL